ncbi:MAG: hypothetical protein JO022_06550, partial [Acidobacteriaceae bacterium]|nr:hypothetical protein [Acidobacteriaceae bacterium]
MRLFALLLALSPLRAAELKLPHEFEEPARLALSAPPEFAAAALLRLVESGRVQDEQTKRTLLDEAFDLAAHSHFQIAMRAPSSQSDSAAASLAKAYALHLDSASLQSRAVLAMLQFNRVRAREMFLSMPQPELPALTCKDALVYDVEAFYRALGAVARSGFSAKERARQDHVSLLLQYAGGVHTAAQVDPMNAAIA